MLLTRQPQQPEFDQSKVLHLELLLGLTCGHRGPRTWASLCCIPRESKELDKKRSSWDLNQYPLVVPTAGIGLGHYATFLNITSQEAWKRSSESGNWKMTQQKLRNRDFNPGQNQGSAGRERVKSFDSEMFLFHDVYAEVFFPPWSLQFAVSTENMRGPSWCISLACMTSLAKQAQDEDTVSTCSHFIIATAWMWPKLVISRQMDLTHFLN